MKFVKVFIILVFVFGALFSAAVSIVGNHAINVMAEQAANPSAADLVFQSRQTPAVTADRTGAAWFGAGLLALSLVCVGAAVFTMKGGTDLLKQWRLARKRSMQQRPMFPIQQAYPPNIQGPPITPTARQLREVNEYEQQDDYPYYPG